jgi:hypothetical protein
LAAALAAAGSYGRIRSAPANASCP